MQLRQFQQWLDGHIQVIETVCQDVNMEQLRALKELAATHSSITLKALSSVIEAVDLKKGDGPNARNLSHIVDAFVGATRTLGKVSAVKSLDTFASALSKRKDEDFGNLVEAVDLALAQKVQKSTSRRNTASLSDAEVGDYVQQLEAALGKDAVFDQTFHSIKADDNLKAQDAKNIARSFVGKSGRSKAEAFRLIYERHSSLVESRARAVATGGRSAA